MLATVINVILVLVGSCVGLLLKNRFPERLGKVVMTGIALCTLGIGMKSLLGTQDTLCVVICLVAGLLLGEWIGIERGMDAAGEFLRAKLKSGKGESRFVEGFVTATILYCVGAMTINGAIAAGLEGDYSILIAKGVMDGISSITFSAALGVGVAFSALPILIYQGGLTLLAGWVGPCLSPEVITEMSAVGGAIIVGISLNMLGAARERIHVGNMLPGIFLPIAYVPLAAWLGSLMG